MDQAWRFASNRGVSAWPSTGDGLHLSPFARSSDAPARDFQQFLLRRAAEPATIPRPALIDAAGARTKKSARLEAVLFVTDGALSARRLAQLATLADSSEALEIIDELNSVYDREGSAFRIERAANGYLLLTRPEFSRWLSRIHQRQNEIKLSPPALETLTVIAYRQPITRADIEALRGVQCAEMLKQLMERGLVRIAGEDNSLGRPYLYETTRKFLELFGLHRVDELPPIDGLRLVVDRGAESAPRN